MLNNITVLYTSEREALSESVSARLNDKECNTIFISTLFWTKHIKAGNEV